MRKHEMTKEQAKYLIWFYATAAQRFGCTQEIITSIYERYSAIKKPSKSKTMRWLGFCQGWMVSYGYFSLDDVKRHSEQACYAS